MLQLERLKSSALAGVTVLAISPDPPGKTRELIEKVRRSKDVVLTHRFLSDPDLRVTDAYGIRNSESKRPLPHPTTVLVDLDGREVWRFTEKDYERRPTDDELRAAVGRLHRGGSADGPRNPAARDQPAACRAARIPRTISSGTVSGAHASGLENASCSRARVSR